MIFSIGFVRNPSLPTAFSSVGIVQKTQQEVTVSMPIIKDGDAPR